MRKTVQPRRLSDAEILAELRNLDGSNGWGVDYREGVVVLMPAIIRNVVRLVEEHGSYPLDESPESDFWFLLRRTEQGEYELLEHWERANFVVETDRWVGDSVTQYARQLAGSMFRKHLNGVQVLDEGDA